MGNERKILYYKKQTDALKNMVKSLEQSNMSLSVENDSLKNMVNSMNENIEILSDEMIILRELYSNSVSELNSTRLKYEEAISDIRNLKKKYRKEMDTFLSGIRKRK